MTNMFWLLGLSGVITGMAALSIIRARHRHTRANYVSHRWLARSAGYHS